MVRLDTKNTVFPDGTHRMRRGRGHLARHNPTFRTCLLLFGVPHGHPAGHFQPAQPSHPRSPTQPPLPVPPPVQPHPLRLPFRHGCSRHSRHRGGHLASRPLQRIRTHRFGDAPARCGLDQRQSGDSILVGGLRHRCGHSPGRRMGGFASWAPDLQHRMPRGRHSRPIQPMVALPFRHRHRPLHQLPQVRACMQSSVH